MPEVIIYTTSTCPHCRSAKEYLKSRGIRYLEKNVETDSASASELASANIMGVPAFKINGEFIIGFNKNRIDELMKYDVVKCPGCSQKLRLPAGKGKLRATCRNCGHTFMVTT